MKMLSVTHMTRRIDVADQMDGQMDFNQWKHLRVKSPKMKMLSVTHMTRRIDVADQMDGQMDFKRELVLVQSKFQNDRTKRLRVKVWKPKYFG